NISPEANPDPITGAPGAHPVGTGVGAAGGGAAGALIGTAAGPIGTAVGAVVGAVAGGLAGKGVAESVNPTAEEEYWRDNYTTRPYVREGEQFNDYQSAYRYGWESRCRYDTKSFDDVEEDLAGGWEGVRGTSRLNWDRARQASKDAWDRVDLQMQRRPGQEAH